MNPAVSPPPSAQNNGGGLNTVRLCASSVQESDVRITWDCLVKITAMLAGGGDNQRCWVCREGCENEILRTVQVMVSIYRDIVANRSWRGMYPFLGRCAWVSIRYRVVVVSSWLMWTWSQRLLCRWCTKSTANRYERIK